MKLNKLLYIFGASALLIANTGCADFFEEHPDSYLAQETALTGPNAINNANMLVIGVYDVFAKIEHYGQYEMATPTSDDMYFINGTNSDDSRRDISHYNTTITNTWLKYLWQYKYQGIDRANAVIASIENMDAYKNKEDKNNKTVRGYVAEARFLRAFLAFDLIKYWGDVPFKTQATEKYEDAYQGRVDREKIYDQIIEDLNFAKDNLEWANASSSPERAKQGAARALLMRVYLQRAGYSLGVLKNFGKMTRPDDAVRKAYFQEVVKEWEAFKANGYHNFYDEGFTEFFKNFSAGKLSSKESLWEIAFHTHGGTDKEDSSNWGTYIGQRVDAPSGADAPLKKMGRANAFFRVVPAWRDFYEENDERRDVTVCSSFWYINKKTGEHQEAPCYMYKGKYTDEEQDENGNLVLNGTDKDGNPKWNRTIFTPGKWRREWMPIGYKDPNNVSVNYCVLRYADVVLMAAEAYNELGQSSESWKLINDVRRRAHATEINASNYADFYKAPRVYDLPYISDADEAGKVRTAIYWERGFELAFEGQRKYDLIRWNCLGDALKLFGEKDTDHNKPSQPQSKHAYPALYNFKSGQHELFPIPVEELQINKKLEQNPGYTH